MYLVDPGLLILGKIDRFSLSWTSFCLFLFSSSNFVFRDVLFLSKLKRVRNLIDRYKAFGQMKRLYSLPWFNWQGRNRQLLLCNKEYFDFKKKNKDYFHCIIYIVFFKWFPYCYHLSKFVTALQWWHWIIPFKLLCRCCFYHFPITWVKIENKLFILF
jgi:hypothetical protein